MTGPRSSRFAARAAMDGCDGGDRTAVCFQIAGMHGHDFKLRAWAGKFSVGGWLITEGPLGSIWGVGVFSVRTVR